MTFSAIYTKLSTNPRNSLSPFFKQNIILRVSLVYDIVQPSEKDHEFLINIFVSLSKQFNVHDWICLHQIRRIQVDKWRDFLPEKHLLIRLIQDINKSKG